MFDTVQSGDKEQLEVLEAYKNTPSARMDAAYGNRHRQWPICRSCGGKRQSTARARLEQATDAYMRDRLHDLDDLSNRLLRILTGQGKETGADMPLIQSDCLQYRPRRIVGLWAQPKGYRSGRRICGQPRDNRGPGQRYRW